MLGHCCFDGPDMVYDTVVSEINAVRAEKGLIQLYVDWSTPLEDLGFDSLTYVVLVLRIDKRLASAIFKRAGDDISQPAMVADLVALFESALSGIK